MSDTKNVNIKDFMDNYDFPCTLIGSGQELRIRPITTMQLKKLLTYENDDSPNVIENALDSLISESVATEGFDINDLYLQDRFQLLLEVRKISKGASYTFNYHCPTCGMEVASIIDLNDLKVEAPKALEGVIDMSDKLQFKVGFPTRTDQVLANEYVRAKPGLSQKQQQLDSAITTYAKSVKSVIVDGQEQTDVPLEDIIYVLENVSTEVFDKFKKWFVDNNFGVEFKSVIHCLEGHPNTIDIPIENFFA